MNTLLPLDDNEIRALYQLLRAQRIAEVDEEIISVFLRVHQLVKNIG